MSFLPGTVMMYCSLRHSMANVSGAAGNEAELLKKVHNAFKRNAFQDAIFIEFDSPSEKT